MAPSSSYSYAPYVDESQLPDILALVDDHLSEPYNFYTLRFFVSYHPSLCLFAYAEGETKPVGVAVSKLDPHKNGLSRGYIGMLSVAPAHRGKGIATKLTELTLEAMRTQGADEVVLETEVDNAVSLHFYERLGFRKTKRLHRFYLNSKDAFRMVLTIPEEIRVQVEPNLGKLHLSD